jgi:hypothetical protein
MGNVLRREKREQVIALGRLGWSLRRIEEATGVRRETVGEYLRRVGVAIRPVGSWGEKSLAKAATSVITGSGEEAAKAATSVITGSGEEAAKAATQVITGFFAAKTAANRTASASEPYREWIAQELGRGRNAMGIWQDLVDAHGFAGSYQSVQRLVRGLRGAKSPEARVIIETRIGEDYGKFRVMVRNGGDPKILEEDIRRASDLLAT